MKVINGSFINLKGIVISVKDSNNIIMKPNNIRLENQIFNSNEICKGNVLICNREQSINESTYRQYNK